ncbi:MAG: hypothetical protein JXR19_06040 [Bacteroidia bacterium]
MVLNLKHIVLSLSLFIGVAAFGNDTLSLDSSITVSLISSDSKGNMFIADQENNIIKLSKDGKEITRVNTKLYGEVYSIDCSNPFEIYVFYRDQNMIVFYDNMLNVRGEIDLTVFGYGNIRAACRSFDNGMWVYDLSSLEIKKIQKDGVITQNSGPISNFIDGSLNPHSIIEYNNQVYLADSSLGILVFDMFGTYIKKIPLLGITDFDVENDLLVALVQGKLMSYHLKEFVFKKYDFASHYIKHFDFTSGRILVPVKHQIIRLSAL